MLGAEFKGKEQADCQNCGAEVTGRFCSACGQEATDTVMPFRSFLKQGVEDLLAFDFRYPRTLRGLLEPGELTANYLAGKRVPYSPPLRFAFNASILLLIAIALRLPESSGITTDSMAGDDLGFLAREYALVMALAQLVALPFWAVVLRLGFKQTQPLYLSHLIFALHYHTAVTVSVLFVVLVSFISPIQVYGALGILLLTIILGPYLILALRRTYEATWLRSLLLWSVNVFAYLLFVLMFAGFFTGLAVGVSHN